MMQPNASELFASWVLILQVASRCDPPGTLQSSSGEPYTAESLEIITRGKAAWFTSAFEYLTKIGWLKMSGTSPSGTQQGRDGDLTGTAQGPVQAIRPPVIITRAVS